jgi:hypothetical protein
VAIIRARLESFDPRFCAEFQFEHELVRVFCHVSEAKFMSNQSLSGMTAEAGFQKIRRQEQVTRASTESQERGADIDANTTRLRELRLNKERADKDGTALITPASRRKLQGRPAIVA